MIKYLMVLNILEDYLISIFYNKIISFCSDNLNNYLLYNINLKYIKNVYVNSFNTLNIIRKRSINNYKIIYPDILIIKSSYISKSFFILSTSSNFINDRLLITRSKKIIILHVLKKKNITICYLILSILKYNIINIINCILLKYNIVYNYKFIKINNIFIKLIITCFNEISLLNINYSICIISGVILSNIFILNSKLIVSFISISNNYLLLS